MKKKRVTSAKKAATGWEPDVCCFHANCIDGFTAAWAIWKRWPDCKFIPMSYDDPVPDVSCARVLMVDFSLKTKALETMAKSALSVVILDHHKSAEIELSRFHKWDSVEFMQHKLNHILTENKSNVVVHFDMEHSGANLAWRFAHASDVPEIVNYVEDRDLWRHKLDGSAEHHVALGQCNQDFREWEHASLTTAELVADGSAMLRQKRKQIARMLEAGTYWTNIGGHSVPVCNCPGEFASDAGHELLKQYPMAPFAATWHRHRDGTVKFSLRSDDSRTDVSVVAAARGGGGHRNASGFTQTAV